ncbi:MAG TPA: hypothetical protein VFO10_16735 [Oligoflexus sp.]|uniref:hypothetical protein n=1 Tax=Oligoflexus sp. TaxID=1971216 RepID=UPI002D7F5C64|nr:hypothetical protein [Oligoflexus sp.]HET9238906.1 hypothetical protein [Oligoflexus sp.]
MELRPKARNLLLFMLLPACAAPKEEPEVNVRYVVPYFRDLFMDMPSSLSASSGSPVWSYGGSVMKHVLVPHSMMGMVEDWSGSIQTVMNELFGQPECLDIEISNDLPDCSKRLGVIVGYIDENPIVFTVTPGSLAVDPAPSHVKYYKNAAGSDYDYTFEIYWKNKTTKLHVPGLVFQVTKVSDTSSRVELSYYSSVASNSTAGGSMQALLDESDESASMSVKIFDNNRTSDELLPARWQMDVLRDTSGVLTGSAVGWRPEMAEDKGTIAPLNTRTEMGYAFTFAADTAANYAALNVAAFPVESFRASSSYFSSFDINSILKRYTLDFVRASSPSWDCNVIGGLFNLPANICTTNTTVADKQVLDGLSSFCARTPTAVICGNDRSEYRLLANPLYFDGSGLRATGVTSKPSDARYTDLEGRLSSLTVPDLEALKAETSPSPGAGTSAVP